VRLPPISTGGLRSLRRGDDPYALLDVRQPPETSAGHIPGASAVPLGELDLRSNALLPVGTVPVVVVDGDEDGRAELAAQLLVRHGCRAVHVLEGGMARWRADGGEVATGRNVPSKRFGEELLATSDATGLLVDPGELAAELEGPGAPVIFDVRTPSEHRREHVPGARNVPGFGVVAAAAALADPMRPIVVHCSGRTRGIVAAATLRRAGFDATALHDGTMGWVLAGLPVARGGGPADPADEVGDDVLERLRVYAREVGVEVLDADAAVALLAQRPRPLPYAFDVRDPGQGPAGTAAGFVQVASGQLIQQLDEHLAVRGVGALVACETGGVRSLVAATWLRELGVPRVAVVRGGARGLAPRCWALVATR
jgi:rhodanese-related sulfurtransferase